MMRLQSQLNHIGYPICKELEITSDECSVDKIITMRHFVSTFKVSLMIDNVLDMYNCNKMPSYILVK